MRVRLTFAPARVFLLCLAIFLVNGRPHPEVDTVAAPYVAWSLVRHGSFDLRAYPNLQPYLYRGGPIRVRADGAWVSMRPPGSALAAVPFVAGFAIAHDQPLRDVNMQQLGKLAGAVSVAAAAALFFVVCGRMAPSAAWPATLLFALGTCLYSVASQSLWMHGPAVFWLCAALYFLIGRGDIPRDHLAAGFALGCAVLTRPSVAFFAVATIGAFVLLRRWRGLGWLALGGLAPAILLLQYNSRQFGHALLGGYEGENWMERPPWWLGLGGLLIAPSRGLLVYSPALVLAPLGAWILLRQRWAASDATRAVLLTWLGAAIATWVFYGRFFDWLGGFSYGPRYLTETMPVLCLLFALAFERLRAGWPRRAAAALVALSVAVHAVGVFGHSGYQDWQVRHMLPDHGRSLFDLGDTQIEAHARAIVEKLGGPPRVPMP